MPKKHDRADFKFNGGLGALLCSECKVIMKIGRDFIEEEKKAIKGHIKLPPQYCEKCKQKKLLIEIMQADEKDGLYEPAISKMETTQTAVEWLFETMAKTPMTNWYEVREQALTMEKEQIRKSFQACWIANMPDGFPCKMSSIEYYNETYSYGGKEMSKM